MKVADLAIYNKLFLKYKISFVLSICLSDFDPYVEAFGKC